MSRERRASQQGLPGSVDHYSWEDPYAQEQQQQQQQQHVRMDPPPDIQPLNLQREPSAFAGPPGPPHPVPINAQQREPSAFAGGDALQYAPAHSPQPSAWPGPRSSYTSSVEGRPRRPSREPVYYQPSQREVPPPQRDPGGGPPPYIITSVSGLTDDQEEEQPQGGARVGVGVVVGESGGASRAESSGPPEQQQQPQYDSWEQYPNLRGPPPRRRTSAAVSLPPTRGPPAKPCPFKGIEPPVPVPRRSRGYQRFAGEFTADIFHGQQERGGKLELGHFVVTCECCRHYCVAPMTSVLVKCPDCRHVTPVTCKQVQDAPYKQV